MECILTGCEEEVAPGRMWFCEGHYAEAVKWWQEELSDAWHPAVVLLAKALKAIGTTVGELVGAIEKPRCYPEEAYWLHTLHEHKDMVAAGTAMGTRAVKGAPQQLAGAYLVQECGCDDCRR